MADTVDSLTADLASVRAKLRLGMSSWRASDGRGAEYDLGELRTQEADLERRLNALAGTSGRRNRYIATRAGVTC